MSRPGQGGLDEPVALYAQVRDYVFDLIDAEAGLTRIPSERALCRICGASRPTVRRALESLTDEGVLVPRRGLGTFVNRAAFARATGDGDSRAPIGLALYHGHLARLGAYGVGMLAAVNNRLAERGHPTVLLTSFRSGYFAARDLAARGVSSLLWFAPDRDQLVAVRCLRDKGIRVLTVNRAFRAERIDYVCVSEQGTGRAAAEHLLALGHRHTLYVRHAEQTEFATQRYRGFSRAYVERGLKHPRALRLSLASQACAAITDALRENPEITAVFVAEGAMAAGAFNALRDAGRMVPDDCSLVVHDFHDPERHFGIELTTVHYPVEQLGRLAADRICDLVEGKRHNAVREELDPILGIGSSTRALP